MDGIVAPVRASQPGRPRRVVPAPGAVSKVPQITAIFWVIKVLTTAQGEAVADFLFFRYGPVIVGAVGATGLIAALALQFRARRYIAGIYWFAVVMVAVFGTLAADGLHIVMGVPYLWSAAFYGSSLAVIFAVWYATEKTLSIHSIYTWRREAFYWATVMATFALGTAVGDLTAITFHLGYLASGIVFAVVIAVPAVAHRRFGLNPILAFWLAYIVTRPLGASGADWLAVSHALGGVGLGRGPVGLGLTIVIAGLVGYLSVTWKDVGYGTPRPPGGTRQYGTPRPPGGTRQYGTPRPPGGTRQYGTPRPPGGTRQYGTPRPPGGARHRQRAG